MISEVSFLRKVESSWTFAFSWRYFFSGKGLIKEAQKTAITEQMVERARAKYG